MFVFSEPHVSVRSVLSARLEEDRAVPRLAPVWVCYVHSSSHLPDLNAVPHARPKIYSSSRPPDAGQECVPADELHLSRAEVLTAPGPTIVSSCRVVSDRDSLKIVLAYHRVGTFDSAVRARLMQYVAPKIQIQVFGHSVTHAGA